MSKVSLNKFGFAGKKIGCVMTEKQKKYAEIEMYNLWKQFIYEETMSGTKEDYRHLDMIIRRGSFIKKYVQCGRKICVYWIFILCDGEYGYFDGYHLWHEIPVALAKLLDIEKDLDGKEFSIENGNYIIN